MKTSIILFTLLMSSLSFAQIESFDSTYIDGLKKDVGGTFKEIVKSNLILTEDEAKVFWPVFDEYMAARSPIFDQRANLTEEYMMNYYGMDDVTAKDLINKTMMSYQELLDLRQEFINKMFEKLPAQLVGKFFQPDNRVTTVADLVRMSSTPLVRDKE